MILNTKATKVKIDKLGYIKALNSCAPKIQSLREKAVLKRKEKKVQSNVGCDDGKKMKEEKNPKGAKGLSTREERERKD